MNTGVLIESDWNLKSEWTITVSFVVRVLIESDWNLKFYRLVMFRIISFVLIESDWNLKLFIGQFGIFHHMRINRIRLEFKVFMANYLNTIFSVY